MKTSRNGHISKEQMVDWQKRLYKRGWIAPNWPKEYGGQGFDTFQQLQVEGFESHSSHCLLAGHQTRATQDRTLAPR